MFGRSLFSLNCLLRPSQVTLVDTVGAWPTFQCEVSGQSEAIATNLTVMAGLKVPIVTGKHALLLLVIPFSLLTKYMRALRKSANDCFSARSTGGRGRVRRRLRNMHG